MRLYYSEDTYECYRWWDIGDEDDPTPRHHLYRTLWQLLYPMRDVERRKALDDLLAWGNAKSKGRLTHRVLSASEVVQLAQGGLVELGAHSVTHASLPTLPMALQQNEIQESKKYLEETVGRPVSSFAYPYGDYTAETVAVVREAGLACACTTISDGVRRRTDHYQSPRVQVLDWDGEEFARQLSKGFHSD